jgi:STE24 endopeptidase
MQVFIGTALFYELHTPIVAVFSLLTLVVRRYFEFQSDSYAVRLGYGQELRQSLVKLYKDSAPKIRPDVMYAWVNYSHPSLWERIENIDRLMEKQEQQVAAWLRRTD